MGYGEGLSQREQHVTALVAAHVDGRDFVIPPGNACIDEPSRTNRRNQVRSPRDEFGECSSVDAVIPEVGFWTGIPSQVGGAREVGTNER